MIYIPINTKEHIVKELQNRGLPLAVTMPRGMFGTERTIASKLEQFLKWDVSHVWAGNGKQRCTGKITGLQHSWRIFSQRYKHSSS